MNGMFQMFKNTYGSVLFFNSVNVITESGKTHASAAHMFDEFSQHASGMTQILVWTALELEGLGANLQHMNAIPPVEEAIKRFIGVPETNKLRAQLVMRLRINFCW
ncbi:nitroreductase family protein [Beauveria brongniartii RCEF 3172]|uniref:Nitroreductase family protein n=1 Tax=Beauveria brongniartii RCEF 3172 TaxID=1081107 RepID=A0A167GLN0_9HYPO|nr:nitroreductase family protein [Beauveria brongniartii RCEF 3172]